MLSKILSTRVWIILESATFSYRIQKFSRSHIGYLTQTPLSTRIRLLVSGFTPEKLGLHVMPPFNNYSPLATGTETNSYLVYTKAEYTPQ